MSDDVSESQLHQEELNRLRNTVDTMGATINRMSRTMVPADQRIAEGTDAIANNTAALVNLMSKVMGVLLAQTQKAPPPTEPDVLKQALAERDEARALATKVAEERNDALEQFGTVAASVRAQLQGAVLEERRRCALVVRGLIQQNKISAANDLYGAGRETGRAEGFEAAAKAIEALEDVKEEIAF